MGEFFRKNVEGIEGIYGQLFLGILFMIPSMQMLPTHN